MNDRFALPKATLLLCALAAAALCALDGAGLLAARSRLIETEGLIEDARLAAERPPGDPAFASAPDPAIAEAELRSLILSAALTLEGYAGTEEGPCSFSLLADRGRLRAFLEGLSGSAAASALSSMRLSRAREGTRVSLELDHGTR